MAVTWFNILTWFRTGQWSKASADSFKHFELDSMNCLMSKNFNYFYRGNYRDYFVALNEHDGL